MRIRKSGVAFLAFLGAVSLAAQQSVLTNRYDNLGTGANLQERVLNVSNVNPARFGKLFHYAVSGSVFAQPLYLPRVSIPGRGVHNVIYIATMDDRIYAFDADGPGDPLWQRDLTNAAKGITPMPIADVTGNNNLNIVGNVGILSTPVIDSGAGLLYLVARTKEREGYFQRVYALDVHTGKDRMPPSVIRARIASMANDAVDGPRKIESVN